MIKPWFRRCTFSPARAALRDLARGGIAVASSIHAPSPDTFALFDRVLILQRGRAVYFGENGGEGWGVDCLAGAWQGAWRGLCATYHARLSACSAHVSQPLRTHTHNLAPSLSCCISTLLHRRGVPALLCGAVPGAAPHAALGGRRRLHVRTSLVLCGAALNLKQAVGGLAMTHLPACLMPDLTCGTHRPASPTAAST